MFFFASKILWWLVEPTNVLAVAVCLATLLLLLGRVRTARRIFITVASFILALALLPLPQLLIQPLEQRFARPDPLPARVDGIVLLGGAQVPSMTREYGTPALNGAANTVTSFMWLARRFPEAKLIFAGGSGDILDPKASEAETLRLFFEQQGFDASRVVLEGKSRNTHENVAFAKELARPKPGEVWLLITQAMHVPRSVGVFRQAGWEVVPYPEVYRYGRRVEFGIHPHIGHSLALFGAGLREWLGLAAYAATGRSAAFFPAP
ncbi:MAG: YdcF family protein [Alphaproteobacteria bacterium]